MKHSTIKWMILSLLLAFFIPSDTRAVIQEAGTVAPQLTERQQKRVEKLRSKLRKKIKRKQEKARKRGKVTGDVMDNPKFVWGLVALAGGLALALLAGLFGISYFSFLAGLVAVAGVVLIVLGILEVY